MHQNKDRGHMYCMLDQISGYVVSNGDLDVHQQARAGTSILISMYNSTVVAT
jgi:hypothetical protein